MNGLCSQNERINVEIHSIYVEGFYNKIWQARILAKKTVDLKLQFSRSKNALSRLHQKGNDYQTRLKYFCCVDKQRRRVRWRKNY